MKRKNIGQFRLWNGCHTFRRCASAIDESIDWRFHACFQCIYITCAMQFKLSITMAIKTKNYYHFDKHKWAGQSFKWTIKVENQLNYRIFRVPTIITERKREKKLSNRMFPCISHSRWLSCFLFVNTMLYYIICMCGACITKIICHVNKFEMLAKR